MAIGLELVWPDKTTVSWKWDLKRGPEGVRNAEEWLD